MPSGSFPSELPNPSVFQRCVLPGASTRSSTTTWRGQPRCIAWSAARTRADSRSSPTVARDRCMVIVWRWHSGIKRIIYPAPRRRHVRHRLSHCAALVRACAVVTTACCDVRIRRVVNNSCSEDGARGTPHVRAPVSARPTSSWSARHHALCRTKLRSFRLVPSGGIGAAEICSSRRAFVRTVHAALPPRQSWHASGDRIAARTGAQGRSSPIPSSRLARRMRRWRSRERGRCSCRKQDACSNCPVYHRSALRPAPPSKAPQSSRRMSRRRS